MNCVFSALKLPTKIPVKAFLRNHSISERRTFSNCCLKYKTYLSSAGAKFPGWCFSIYLIPLLSLWNQLSCSVVALVTVQFCSYVVAWKWQWHYPETDLLQTLRGQPWQPPVHGFTLLTSRIEQNTNWQFGLRGTTLEGWEAGKLIPQLYVVRWALEGWRDEWSVSRERRRKRRSVCWVYNFMSS